MKKFKDILSDMASWIALTSSKVTNFSVGSVIRSILEAIAMEIEDLYAYARSKFAEMQENSIYNSFGFPKRLETYAEGFITVKFTQPLSQSVLFEAGSQFYTAPINGNTIYFESIAETIASIGTSEVGIKVRCLQSGTIGNVPAYSITRIVNSTPFLSSIYNKNKFFTGQPEETKEERQKRFNAYLSSLGRASNSAIVYGCMQVPGITGIHIREDIGMIYLYAHDAFGDLSTEQTNLITDKLYDYKAGGVKALVIGVVKKPVDLTIDVLINPVYDKDLIKITIEEEVWVYLSRMTVSNNLVRADLIRFIMEINREAIQNIHVNLTEDIVVQPEELIRPGTITIRDMG